MVGNDMEGNKVRQEVGVGVPVLNRVIRKASLRRWH